MSKVKCLVCGKILESTYRHDFVSCGCPNQSFVDGGNDYIRTGGKDLDKVIVIAPIPDDENTLTKQEVEREIKN